MDEEALYEKFSQERSNREEKRDLDIHQQLMSEDTNTQLYAVGLLLTDMLHEVRLQNLEHHMEVDRYKAKKAIAG